MNAKKGGLGPRGYKLQEWVDARLRHNLTHGHIQMARELGLTPSSLGKLGASGGSAWKVPLSMFIENLYEKRFGKRAPDVIQTAEDALLAMKRKKAAHHARKRTMKEGKTRSPAAQQPIAPEKPKGARE